MSEVRSYLLTVDNDKVAAEDIAYATARSKNTSSFISVPESSN